MGKKNLWLVTVLLAAFTLIIGACTPAAAPPATPTTPPPATTPAPTTPTAETPQQEKKPAAAENPQYGGTLTLMQLTDIVRWDPLEHTVASAVISVVNEELWGGDWAHGPAGGYGTNRTDWAGNYNLWHLNTGVIAENTKWSVDEQNKQGVIVYSIRQGIHYALDPSNAASKLLNGRELTADDVVFHLKESITRNTSYIYRSNLELRGADISKTGDWEVTVKVPLDALITAIDRFGDSTQLVAPEIVKKYGGQFSWQTTVGTGPFILKDYIAGSSFTLAKNNNYWQTDPVGTGKGNRLPYIDRIRYLIIPDVSTRLAALRTGKLDAINAIAWEDAKQLKKQAPELIEAIGPGAGMVTVSMRTDKPPFSDIRVRRAMLMAIDFRALHQSMSNGQGKLLTRPSLYEPGYEDLYVDIDAADMPPTAKENFTYSPEKAKQLLAEAGYPNGFKTSVLITSAQVDDLSLYKFYWDKIGAQVDFNVKEGGTYNSIVNKREHDPMVTASGNPNGVFHTQPSFTGVSATNRVMIDDKYINDMMAKIRLVAITDGLDAALKMTRDVTKHELELALEIPGPGGIASRFWWPWLKNYSGETSVGYFNTYWQTWVWIDQDMKKKMGY